jgi:hypothetical protein
MVRGNTEWRVCPSLQFETPATNDLAMLDFSGMATPFLTIQTVETVEVARCL